MRALILLTLLLTGVAGADVQVATMACGLAPADRAELTQAVVAALQSGNERSRIEVSAMGTWPAMRQARVGLPGRTLRSRMPVSVSGVSCVSGHMVTETLWFKVRALREAWVYGRNARQGRAVSEAVPRREDIDLAALQISASELAESLDGQWLRQEAHAGRPVLQQQLHAEPLVRRDAPVVVVVQAPGLRLLTQGKALQSGAMGERVSVWASGAEASMPAIVTGTGEVHAYVDM